MAHINEETTAVDRRAFLRGVGLGAGAAAVAAVGVVTGTTPAEASPVSADGHRGYQETDHVRQAYKAARF